MDLSSVSTTAAVLLCAGGGTRFAGDGHKLLAPIGGRPVIVWSLGHVIAAGLDEVIVVTGAADLPIPVPPPPTVTVVHNARWADGMASSLRLGVATAAAHGHGAVVVGLGDQPFVPAAAWRAVAAATTPLAVATYGGRRANPVRIAALVWPDLPTDGDAGARALLRDGRHPVSEVPCAGNPLDVDTVDDAAAAQRLMAELEEPGPPAGPARRPADDPTHPTTAPDPAGAPTEDGDRPHTWRP